MTMMVEQFQRFHAFQQVNPNNLITLTTGDLATDEIANDLKNAQDNGQVKLNTFVTERLATQNKPFHDSLKKSKSKTFSTLYKGDVVAKKKTQPVKPDRDIFRKIIVSMESGRPINIEEILQHELCSVPLSLVTMSYSLRLTNKAELAKILEGGAKANTLMQSDLTTCTIIDAMALVRAIGKPHGSHTFGNLADAFIQSVKCHLSETCTRVDVVFDQYKQHSIKCGTRMDFA